MGKKNDPDLAPDAALATDLGDEEDRKAQQLEYFGGEKDDIDDFDSTGLDDGSDPDYVAPDLKDEDTQDGDEDTQDGDEGDEDEKTVDDKDDSDASDADDAKEADDAEADDAEADEDESEDDPDPEPKVKGIPKRRFDEVNERRKAAEEERDALLAEKRAGEEAEDEQYDFDAAETEYMDLLLDGKTAEALTKRKEIRAAEKADFQFETKSEVHSETQQRETLQELNSLSVEAEAMFPVFDRESDDFDADITNKVMVYYRGYVQSGEESHGDAFVQAIADVVEQYGLEEAGAVEDDPEPKPLPKKKDTAKKLEDAKKAHKPVVGEGLSSDAAGAVVPDIENMTDEELDALPEKTLARLRGDFID